MQTYVDILGFTGYTISEGAKIKNKHGRIMKDRRAVNGARQIDIGKATRMVHNLMATAFLGDKPEGCVVKWRNRNKWDNRLQNLYYGRRGVADRMAGMTCSRGHSLASALVWGAGKHRVCADCAAGKPRVVDLPDVL